VPNIMQAEPVLCWLSSLRARYGIPNENNKSTPTMLRISTMCSNRLPTCLLLASYGKTNSKRGSAPTLASRGFSTTVDT
jgi:hypothetical protein